MSKPLNNKMNKYIKRDLKKKKLSRQSGSRLHAINCQAIYQLSAVRRGGGTGG